MWTSATRDIIEKWKEEQYLQAGSTRHARLLCGSVQSRLGSGVDWSQVVGEEQKGDVGLRGGRKREENKVYTTLRLALSFVFHALEKEGVNVKVRAIPWNISSLWSLKKNKLTISPYVPAVYDAFKLVLRFFGSSVAEWRIFISFEAM